VFDAAVDDRAEALHRSPHLEPLQSLEQVTKNSLELDASYQTLGPVKFRATAGQLAEALIRLARFIVCIKLHAEDMSVEQGVRFFKEEAYMEEVSARREAERGTFDPTYLVYSVGKLMLLKLRQDYKVQQGKAFSLRTFHDTLLGNGTAPFWLHRQLMLGDDDGGDLLD